MQKKTALGAIRILQLAIKDLEKNGRPRKPLHRPRPRAVGRKKCLAEAIRLAAVGATRTQLWEALNAVYLGARDSSYHGAWAKMLMQRADYNLPAFIKSYDALELDTREVVRSMKRGITRLQEYTTTTTREAA